LAALASLVIPTRGEIRHFWRGSLAMAGAVSLSAQSRRIAGTIRRERGKNWRFCPGSGGWQASKARV
jgi:hypothetical protein